MDMFTSQEQEHWDHEAGVQTEAQNAFALSKMATTIRDDSQRIALLSAQGFHVAVSEHEVACPHTDALLGYSRRVIGIGHSRAEALALIGDECQEAYVVDPRR